MGVIGFMCGAGSAIGGRGSAMMRPESKVDGERWDRRRFLPGLFVDEKEKVLSHARHDKAMIFLCSSGQVVFPM